MLGSILGKIEPGKLSIVGANEVNLMSRLIPWWNTFLYRAQLLLEKNPKNKLRLRDNYEQTVSQHAERLPTPESLILYVNMRCNARCPHCFIWKLLNTGINEMKLPEIKKLVHSLERPVRLLLTGGEPFLRQDLFDIAKTFEDGQKLQSLAIVTNASLPTLIDKFTRRWLSETNKTLSVQISVDGLEKTHDSIRQIPQGFKKAMETIALLKRYPKSRVGIETSSTIHKRNKGEVMKLIRYFRKRNIQYKFTIMRSNSFSTFGLPRHILSGWDPKAEMIALKPEEIVALVRQVDQKEPDFLSRTARAKLMLTAATLKEKRRLIPCFAGWVEAVIHADGAVSHCEQVKPFGKLKETNYNFKELWCGKAAQTQRPFIRKCSCIHGCNLSTSIMLTSRDLFYSQQVK